MLRDAWDALLLHLLIAPMRMRPATAMHLIGTPSDCARDLFTNLHVMFTAAAAAEDPFNVRISCASCAPNPRRPRQIVRQLSAFPVHFTEFAKM